MQTLLRCCGCRSIGRAAGARVGVTRLMATAAAAGGAGVPHPPPAFEASKHEFAVRVQREGPAEGRCRRIVTHEQEQSRPPRLLLALNPISGVLLDPVQLDESFRPRVRPPPASSQSACSASPSHGPPRPCRRSPASRRRAPGTRRVRWAEGGRHAPSASWNLRRHGSHATRSPACLRVVAPLARPPSGPAVQPIKNKQAWTSSTRPSSRT